MAEEKREPAIGQGLHAVALFEGAKGLLVLLAGFELLSFIHKDLHQAAVQLVEHLHLNPASRYPRIFLDLLEGMDDTRLWRLAIGAAIYAILRMIEAFGLWFGKKWAEWFALVTGGIYVPLELYEAVQHATWPRVTVLVVNTGIVCYLLWEMRSDRTKKKGGSERIAK